MSSIKIVSKTSTNEMAYHCLIIMEEDDTSSIISELRRKFISYLLFIFTEHLILRNNN